MLFNIGGALASINGALVSTTFRIWCECVLGGTCCGGACECGEGECCGGEWYADEDEGECCGDVWRTGEGECCDGEWYTEEGQCCGEEWYSEEGQCCGGEWYPAGNECAPGEVYLVWGPNGECCGCVSETIYDCRVEAQVPAGDLIDDFCCPVCGDPPVSFPYDLREDQQCVFTGCKSRCCSGTSCEDSFQSDCEAIGGTTLPLCCEIRPCPVPCCTGEIPEEIACEVKDAELCEGIVDSTAESCETACKRCCAEGECSSPVGGQCENGGELLDGLCEKFQCPKPCCTEDSDGLVSCEVVEQFRCDGVIDDGTCETACKGACCINGEPIQMTQAECEALSGCFKGLGSIECENATCRPPFDGNCCERVVSSAASLTFRGPRKRQCPEPGTCGFEVTVTVTTGAPVYIHGGLFGSPYEACTQITTFLLCNDEFHVTPAPCSGSLQNLDIEVCWQETGSGPETLRFHCCTATYLLGNCECDCVTTLLYEGNGCTSDADIQMRGDAAIDSSGSGPLVLTEPITHSGSCERKLTLTGTNAGDNELSGVIEDGAGTTVEKTGTGLWRLSAANNYTDGLKVVEGTLVIPVNIDSGTTGSPFGRTVRPQIGGPSAASLLLVGGRSIGRSFDVVAGEGLVTIGGIGSGTASFNSTASIRLGRSVTLQAATGSAVVFAGDWRDAAGGSEPAVAFTLGSAGNIGLVVLQSILPETITSVNVFAGATARLNAGSETIARETPVVVGGGATLDLNGTDQPLESLTMSGNGIVITGGTLRLLDNAVASGSGGEIFSDVSLDGSATIDVAGNLVISGDVSGTSGFAKSGGGTLTLAGEISYTGATSITAGTLVVEKEFAGSADITKSTFTNGTLVVEFAAIPSPSATYQLLGGSTVQTYGPGAVTLTGAGGATGTYNSATSTLTVD